MNPNPKPSTLKPDLNLLQIQEHVNPRFNLEREQKGSGFVDTSKTQIGAQLLWYLLLLLLIRWAVSPPPLSPFFLFLNNEILLGPSLGKKKEKKTLEAHENRSLYVMI